MYSSERAKNIVKKDVVYLLAGIHDDVQLVSAKTEVSPTGSRFVEIRFQKEGKMLTHTEWEPNRRADETEEQFQVKCDNQFKRFDQILECFYPKAEDRAFIGENFAQLATWVVDKLNNADKSILVRIKVVYNNNGYTTLPKYAVYTFIEPMSKVNEGKSVIVELGIDNFTKSVVADIEKANPSPFASTTTSEDNNNVSSLPF